MKIELDAKNVKPVALPGDIIQYNSGRYALVLQNKVIVLLNFIDDEKDSCNFSLDKQGYTLDQGDYKILAREDDWKIVRKQNV